MIRNLRSNLRMALDYKYVPEFSILFHELLCLGLSMLCGETNRKLVYLDGSEGKFTCLNWVAMAQETDRDRAYEAPPFALC